VRYLTRKQKDEWLASRRKTSGQGTEDASVVVRAPSGDIAAPLQPSARRDALSPPHRPAALAQETVPPSLLAELADADRRRIHDQQRHTKSLDASRAEVVRLRRQLEESEVKRQRLSHELIREKNAAAAATSAAGAATVTQEKQYADNFAQLKSEYGAACAQWDQWKLAHEAREAALHDRVAQQQTQVGFAAWRPMSPAVSVFSPSCASILSSWYK
jgi:hypothetical protein